MGGQTQRRPMGMENGGPNFNRAPAGQMPAGTAMAAEAPPGAMVAAPGTAAPGTPGTGTGTETGEARPDLHIEALQRLQIKELHELAKKEGIQEYVGLKK